MLYDLYIVCISGCIKPIIYPLLKTFHYSVFILLQVID